LIFPAARRCFPRRICVTAICGPIRKTRPRCCGRCLRRATFRGLSRSRATSHSPNICARIRDRISSAAIAALICAPPAPSRRTAIMLRSTPRFAPVAVNARRPVRPAPRAMRCRPPTRIYENCGYCFPLSSRTAARMTCPYIGTATRDKPTRLKATRGLRRRRSTGRSPSTGAERPRDRPVPRCTVRADSPAGTDRRAPSRGVAGMRSLPRAFAG